LDSFSSKFKQQQELLGGAGTQASALGFGGYTTAVLQQQQKNIQKQESRYKNNYGKLIWQNI
jgi:hypothetical protein